MKNNKNINFKLRILPCFKITFFKDFAYFR